VGALVECGSRRWKGKINLLCSLPSLAWNKTESCRSS